MTSIQRSIKRSSQRSYKPGAEESTTVSPGTFVVPSGLSTGGKQPMTNKPKLALCAIVRDEAETLPRLAENLKGLIDYWVLVDTGSSDNTIEVAKEVFSFAPGEIHESTWVNFGVNRTELMKYANGKAQWLLCMDADEMLQGKIDLDELDPKVDQYLIEAALGFANWVPRLVNGERNWVWECPVHEYIRMPENDHPLRVKLHDIKMVHVGDGGARHSGGGDGRKKVLMRDIALLEEAVAKNKEDSRSWFYLGQSCFEVGMLERSLEAYRERERCGGWPEEVFYSRYMIGIIYERWQRPKEAATIWLKAWNDHPTRIETLCAAVRLLRNHGMFNLAYALADVGVSIPLSQNDILFVHGSVWDYEMPLEHALCAFYARGPEQCLRESEEILKKPDLPDHVKNFALNSIQVSKRALGEQESTTGTGTAIIVPVMRRPQNAAPFMKSLAESKAQDVTVYAICDSDDVPTVKAWLAAGARVIERVPQGRPGTFAEKTNFGFRLTKEPWIFSLGDDVKFHEGWLEKALSLAERSGAGVVGVNDLGNPAVMAGQHATQMLMARRYVMLLGGGWDGPGVVLHEGYKHNFVDNEVCIAARQRNAFVMCMDSVVEHLHPLWGKGETDDVYKLGLSSYTGDAIRFQERVKKYAS